MGLSIFKKRIQRRIGPSAEQSATMQTDFGAPAEYEGIPLDAVLEEQITDRSTVTSFPVERSSDIHDHVVADPIRYSMTGAVSDLPIYYRSTTYQHADATTRHLSAYAMLRDLKATREPFAMLTGFLFMENMIIESLVARKRRGRSSVFEFDALLVQVNIVNLMDSGDGDIAVLSPGAAEEQASPLADLGQTATGPVPSHLQAGAANAAQTALQVV